MIPAHIFRLSIFVNWPPEKFATDFRVCLHKYSHHIGSADRSRYPTSGTESERQIFRARRFAISVCLGTASTVPVCGFTHSEWEWPSRLSS